MKVEKFKVLLYLKRGGLDKSGKAPIMGRITVNRTMAQFSSKLSCTPELWNPRESRLNGKSKEAVEINAKIDKLLLAINSAYDSLLERKIDFDATAVKEAFQGSVETQMTLLRRLDIHIEDMQSRIGIDVAKSSMSTYIYTRRYLGEFIKKRFKVEDLAFGQLNERKELFPMIHHPNLRRHMKGLRDLAGIKTDLVYHMGRHTFGSLITLEAGVPIETISKMLGHTNLTTTQLYAKVTPKKLFDDMDIFIKATSDMTLVL